AFMFATSGEIVMQTAIGGAGTLFGPLLGAIVWLYLSDFFQTVLNLGATWRLILGIVFVLLVCFLRRGLAGAISDLYGMLRNRRQAAAPVTATTAPIPAPAVRSDAGTDAAVAIKTTASKTGPILQATGL